MDAEHRGDGQEGVESTLQKALRFAKRVLHSGSPSDVGNDRPSRGHVRFGDLAGTAPIDPYFGFGRGTPIDRYYIEAFLDRNRNDIAGRVLEVGDSRYSARFGQGRVTQQDVLHIRSGEPRATIVGDLTAPDVLPRDSFDCIVFTQTLQFIYALKPAVAQLHAALRPGRVLLLTVPGISQIDRAEDWRGTWYWSFSSASVSRLFADVFDVDLISVESHGNVFAATCLLQGLAAEELPSAKLAVQDEVYPVIIALRARKRG